MKEISNIFGSMELGFLKSLIGQEFKFVGGPEAPDFLISDIFVLACSKSSIVVSGSIVEISGIDDFDDFSKMSVEEASADILAATLKSGNMFLLNRRSEITGVSLVRETLVHEENGSPKWSFTSDVGLIVHLVGGDIVLRMLSLSVEAIAVKFVERFTVEEFEEPSNIFENELINSYTAKLDLISIV